MANLHITHGELVEILTEQLADNLRNSRGLPDGEVSSEEDCVSDI